jgi:type II secretory pathway pseudopilin PulG
MKTNLQFFKKYDQQGQTLIETLVAIFILTMGIASALGLAVYANTSASNITKQIVATGLAREGIESVKNMRDTNWLKAPIDSDCYNYQSQSNIAQCYKKWLGSGGGLCPGLWNNSNNDRGFCLDPGGSASGATYIIQSDLSSANRAWVLTAEASNFGLNLDTTVDSGGFSGFFIPTVASAHGNSDFYRKVTIIKSTSNPYKADLERLEVVSQVWWQDKKCPRVSVWPGVGKCGIELRTFLTNWKDY